MLSVLGRPQSGQIPEDESPGIEKVYWSSQTSRMEEFVPVGM